MAKAFYNDFKENIAVVSAYRSYKYQVSIKSGWCPDNLCAKAGFSEHQSGLAVDLWEASTEYNWKTDPKLKKYYKWLEENAYKYGFHNTYQKWLDVDSYEVEPWHFRYLWKYLAKYLYDEKMTFAEYYYQKRWD
jgi:D-alanyl-D-alanine carboxypeptidase